LVSGKGDIEEFVLGILALAWDDFSNAFFDIDDNRRRFDVFVCPIG